LNYTFVEKYKFDSLNESAEKAQISHNIMKKDRQVTKIVIKQRIMARYKETERD